MQKLNFSPSQVLFLDIKGHFRGWIRLEKISALIKSKIHEMFAIHSEFLGFFWADLVSLLSLGGGARGSQVLVRTRLSVLLNSDCFFFNSFHTCA